MPNQRKADAAQRLRGHAVELRPFLETNITPAYLGWLRDPQLMKFSNQRFRQHDEASCLAYLASFKDSDNLFMAIYRDAQFIGTMTAYQSSHHQTADMGLLIGASCQGLGLGKDAWITLMDHLLLTGCRKVTGGAVRCNTAMVRIMESSGMQADGIRKAQELVDGSAQDILHFARFNASCSLP